MDRELREKERAHAAGLLTPAEVEQLDRRLVLAEIWSKGLVEREVGRRIEMFAPQVRFQREVRSCVLSAAKRALVDVVLGIGEEICLFGDRSKRRYVHRGQACVIVVTEPQSAVMSICGSEERRVFLVLRGGARVWCFTPQLATWIDSAPSRGDLVLPRAVLEEWVRG